jgi:putative transposase
MRITLAADLKTVYSAATADEALLRLEEFVGQWGKDSPSIVKSWRNNW